MVMTKKFTSLVLALVMCMALAIPALAAPLPDGVTDIASGMSVAVTDGSYMMSSNSYTYFNEEQLASYATWRTVGCQAYFGNYLDISIDNYSDVSIMLSVTSSGRSVLAGTVPSGTSRTFTISSGSPLTSTYDILFAPAPTSDSAYSFAIRQHG